jgi:hypothetical protein
MTITYEWKIDTFAANPKINNKENVITAIYWSLVGTNEDGVESAFHSKTEIEYDNKSKHIAFDKLTVDIVSQWIIDALGEDTVAEIKQKISNQIDELVAPKTIHLPPPWA